MLPELPKVEQDSLNKEIEQAYEEQAGKMGGAPKAPEDLARAGSVGVEAGLTDFEHKSDDSTSSSDDITDDNTQAQISSQMPPVNPQKQAGKMAVIQTPAVAEDNDDIEKEWVNKAKKIVEQTKSDPYLQERAVSRLQADYMKKRFNKDVKLPKEDQ